VVPVTPPLASLPPTQYGLTVERHDLAVLHEAVRQGERVLSLQHETRESILRRAGELLRLAVATIGGVIVIGGILSAIRLPVTPVLFAVFAVGLSFQVVAAGLFAALLSGGRSVGAFAYGPEPRRLADLMLAGELTEEALWRSLIEIQPDLVADNNRLLIHLQRMNAFAVLTLSTGAALLLGGLFYILGDALLV
jgi:hypothetical protein